MPLKILTRFSNREQNIIGAMVLDGAVTIYYFSHAMALSGGSSLTSPELGWIVGKTIGLAILMAIILQIIINGNKDPEAADERDGKIEGKANAIAYTVLLLGVVTVMGGVLMGSWLEAAISQGHFINAPFFVFHALILAITASDFSKRIAQLLFYRRGY